MVKNRIIERFKDFLSILLIVSMGLGAVIFSSLYFETISEGVIHEYNSLFISCSVALISIITILSIIFYKLKINLVYRLFVLTTVTLLTLTVSLYFLKTSGFLDKIDSVSDMRNYVSSFNEMAVAFFIIIQFLQVVILPIPSLITVGAGVLLFGPLLGAVYSLLGIISGSICAYFIGKIFGVKVVKWLIGADNLKKGLRIIKGKDKILLIFMFIFPFFPDDILCFVAGITTVSPIFFIITIVVTRSISVFATCYSLNNSFIPYNTWWGATIWIIFIILTAVLTFIIYKYGEKIENKIFNLKAKNKRK